MGTVLWLFGLSGAGKTTLAQGLQERLKGSSLLLDGDALRAKKHIGFSRDERIKHLIEVASLAHEKSHTHDFVICSLITPYEDVRKQISEKFPDFIWIWIDCPLEVCEKRDVKGLYQKARNGEILHFTGISDPFEKPLKANIRVATDSETIDSSLNFIICELRK